MDDIIVQEYPQGTAWVHRQRGALDAGARAALWAWLEAEERPRCARRHGEAMGRAMRWYTKQRKIWHAVGAGTRTMARGAYPPALRALRARAGPGAAAARHAPHRPCSARMPGQSV